MAEELTGFGVAAGLAIGPVAQMPRVPAVPADDPPECSPEGELARARTALEAVAVALERQAEGMGASAQGVLYAQAMMARDPGLLEEVTHRVATGASAPLAVDRAVAVYRALLAAAGEYVAARVADLDAVRDRAVAHLLGLPLPQVPNPGHPFVLVARDLAPAEAVTIVPGQVLALVTEEGGPTSHTAILVRDLGIPAVLGCAGATDLATGREVIVDGGGGRVIVAPGRSDLAMAYRRRAARSAARRDTSGPGMTRDGHPVALLANVARLDNLPAAVAAGAEGVGLLRTEFLFADRITPPSVTEQQAAYAEVLKAFPEGRVVIRTLDAGADKHLPFLQLDEEPNPALGRRGLRGVRRWPEVLADQLEAIGRAAQAAAARTWVMAPMIATPGEAGWFCAQVRRQPVALAGVTIELPAAAVCADAILREADFASVGTNDLAQYAFGADRLLSDLAPLLDHWQPALLRLVAMALDAGTSAGRPVGVCGEAAGDPALALVLVGLGAESLSLAPSGLADVRTLLARHTLDECRALAEQVLAAADADHARQQVRATVPALEELGL